MAFPSPARSPLRALESAKATLLLTDPSARRLLPLALSLARACGADLAAYSLRAEHAHLPERLQRLKAGHAGSPADRAVHNLVKSAFSGSQIPLRPTSDLPAPGAPSPPLRMLGWASEGSPPQGPELDAFCAPDPSPLLLLRSQSPPVFDEVLLLAWETTPRASLDALGRIARGLEGPYPLWRLKASKLQELERAQRDLGPRCLLLIAPCARLGLPLDRLPDIDALSTGPIGVLCPSGDPAGYVRALSSGDQKKA